MNFPAPNAEVPTMWDDLELRPYLGEVKRRHGIVDILALPNMRDLPPVRIENLFVQPLLSKKVVNSSSDPSIWPAGESLFDAFQNSPRLVLLGDPGSGKTTLANWLAWRLSSGLTAPLPPILQDRLPIPCVLREMDSSLFEASTKILQIAILVAERLLGTGINSELKNSIAKLIGEKKYVLILDGIDEIPVSRRRRVATWMQTAVEDNAPVLATSRIVGYDDFPIDRPHSVSTKILADSAIFSDYVKFNAEEVKLFSVEKLIKAEDFSHLMIESKKDAESLSKWINLTTNISRWAEIRYLMPFDGKRISAFVENWYLQRSGSEAEGRRRSEDLIFSLSQSEVTSELARTPNLLSLMAIVHRERAHLPDGRALLYKEISNAYVNTIDQFRKILPNDALAPYGWEIRENWIAYVGFQMQLQRNSRSTRKNGTDGVLVSEKDVLNWLKIAMTISGVSQAKLSAEEFLKWVARRSGLLLPRGEGRFSFVHLSFQEYFCARYMANKIVSPKFINSEEHDDEDSVVSKGNLEIWASKNSWRESLVYLFELISAERDVEWTEYLAEVIFGGRENFSYFDTEKSLLAAKILTNRHIHIDLQRKKNLATRCSGVASQEARAYYSSTLATLRALVRTGDAIVFVDPDDSEILRYSRANIPVNNISEIAGVESNNDLLILIAKSDVQRKFPNVEKLEKLRALSLANFEIIDFDFLRRMENLLFFELRRCTFDGEVDLSNLKDLREVRIISSGAKKIPLLKGVRAISSFDISRNYIKDISSLRFLSQLNILYLDNNEISSIKSLRGLEKLMILSFDGNNVSDISFIDKMKDLFILYFDNNPVSDISVLAGLEKISVLSMKNTLIDSVLPLSNLKKLEKLNLNGTRVSNISTLSGNLEMIELDLGNTKIEDLRPIRKMQKLKKLVLNNTAVKNLNVLNELKNLSELEIMNVGNDSWSYSGGNKNIKIKR